MSVPEIYSELTTIFNDIFAREDIVLTPTTSAKDVEDWDSFKQIEIVMAVEERFGVKLLTREVSYLRNVGDLVTAIQKKVA